MIDKFFTQTHCDRCGKPLDVRFMSWFNTDTICEQCHNEEHNHPDFEKAVVAEHAAIQAGNMNFSGIGWNKR